MKNTISKLFIVFATATTLLATACNKDDKPAPNTTNNSNNGGGGGNNGGNSYTYEANTQQITEAQYLYNNDDVYLFLYGGGANYVQLIFPGKKSTIPVGTYTNNSERYSPGYDVSKNFWGGSVTTEINPLGYQISGGTVTISQSGSDYTISFDVTVNDNGTGKPAKGSYTGSLKSR
jgi:hypothetical protein